MNCLLLVVLSAVFCIHMTTSASVTGRTLCEPGDIQPKTRDDFGHYLPTIKEFITNVTGSPLSKYKLSGFIFGPEDPHMSDYPSKIDRKYTLFTGLKIYEGYVILTKNKAAFWTDERYFQEADDILTCDWSLMKLGDPASPTFAQWIDSVIGEKDSRNIGIDASLITEETFTSISNSFASLRKRLALIPIEGKYNPVDLLMKLETNPPLRPFKPINVLDLKFAGVSWQDKLKSLRAKMVERNVGTYITTALDEIAWLFNLRGSDFEYTPYFYAYTVVTSIAAGLFVVDNEQFKRLHAEPTDSESQINVNEHFGNLPSGRCKDENRLSENGNCIIYGIYNIVNITLDLERFITRAKIWISPETNYEITSFLKNTIVDTSPIASDKLVKSPQERIGMRNANIRDSVALIRFLAFLEKEITSGRKWSETEVAFELKKRRRDLDYNRGLSFETVAAYGSNGAIPYYRIKESAPITQISTDGLFILDSGGQYLDGTTEVTRTMHYGKPTDYQKECYTKVLMAKINIAMAKWPEGLLGSDLDTLARHVFWEAGQDFRHVPTHGVGGNASDYQGLAMVAHRRRPGKELPLKAYQYYTDEVGYYVNGQFGVRLSSVLGIVPFTSKHKTQGEEFLQFEPATLVPFESNLINHTMLTKGQMNWLNEYNSNILKYIRPLLKDDSVAMEWINARTKPVKAFDVKGTFNMDVDI